MSKLIIPFNFERQNKEPLDVDSKVETLADLETLKSKKTTYEGMLTYCVEDSTLYIFNADGEFEPVSNNQSATYDTLETTDKTLVGAINEVNGNSLDTVGFSADYKNIILNRKSGLNPYTIPISTIINNASLTELKDVDSTDIGNGKTLVYDETTSKHKYVDTTGTDEFVKMDSTTDAKYLGDLIDKSTVVNDNGVLKVKKLDGQEVTITEINYLKGLTMNVMDLVNAFASGGVKVLNTPLNTASELDTMDRTSFIEGISYIVYVLADENHAGAKTTYLVDKTNTTFFGNADSQRNFTTNPIDLANEVTGKLGTSNIDVDNLWALLTINDTYKTLTTNNEIFGTHGAKAMYDELTTEIGAKANATDLTTHTSDTDIHVTSAERTKWDKVTDKVDKTSITTTIDSTSTDTQVPSAKSVYDTTSKFLKTYTSLADLGLTEPVTVGKIFKAMSIKTMAMISCEAIDESAGTVTVSDIPEPFGVLTIKKSGVYRFSIEYQNSLGNNVVNVKKWIGTLKGADGTGLYWKEVFTDETRVTTLETQVSGLFQSVSNGKSLVANAITGKGVSTSSTATFATMATNIGKISVSGYKEETKSYNNTSSGITSLRFTFSANVLGVKQVIPPTYSCRIVTQTSSDIFTINGKELTFYVTGAGIWEVTALIKA